MLRLRRHFIIRHFFAVFVLFGSKGFSQENLPPIEPPPYDKREEIIHNGKRYRIHNNYLTLGGGFLNSTLRFESQKCLALDFVFHIRRQHFQAGAMMSGLGFGDNNNTQGHLGYGYRIEKNLWNVAGFIGPGFSYGVEGIAGVSAPVFYNAYSVYMSVQAVSKFLFDVGLGLELFGDISKKQQMFGFKIIAFFSGAYRGPKRNVNPHVRSENPR